jgi:hypothetical protein
MAMEGCADVVCGLGCAGGWLILWPGRVFDGFSPSHFNFLDFTNAFSLGPILCLVQFLLLRVEDPTMGA